MRDAYGGITSLVIMVVFLVLVSGYLAFNVNYTKAFKVKNKIISLFEQYEGECGESPSSKCDQEIAEYITKIGYSSPNFTVDLDEVCPSNAYGYCDSDCQKGYCWVKVPVERVAGSNIQDSKKRAYYRISTQIYMDIPIINKILPGLKIFEISGDTRTIVLAD